MISKTTVKRKHSKTSILNPIQSKAKKSLIKVVQAHGLRITQRRTGRKIVLTTFLFQARSILRWNTLNNRAMPLKLYLKIKEEVIIILNVDVILNKYIIDKTTFKWEFRCDKVYVVILQNEDIIAKERLLPEVLPCG
jgi:hypothetical protein